ncbi:DNA replication/repair protein RecF [Altererythrobacter lauratis]|uniref:DNA replication and repair protein RecF n=1 Tax=Alteraurantiacibacter lauratis TaxID=2054627 RepID=A0ABV7EDJ5_9SPHN
MALDRITLSTFRNHAATRLDGAAHFNLLVGENGAGKTNVLEALSLLAPGRGLRRAPLAEMAGQSGGGTFAISATLRTGDDATVQLGTGTQPDAPARRVVQINGAGASALALGEWLAIGWLTPAMDRLFADTASARRRYLDRLAVALDPTHARHASQYEAALRERNRLLADAAEPDPVWLDSIEAQMAEGGAALAAGREGVIAALSAALADLPDEPFARPDLTYVAGGGTSADALRAEWRRGRGRDRAAGRTLTGPHRDELNVQMAAKSMPAAQCSTGEQKAMLIAITLAHAGLAAGGRPGVLLLDEVAAHLDPLRRAALFERLRAGGSQVWLTGTETAPFADILDEAAVWQVAGGTVERVA